MALHPAYPANSGFSTGSPSSNYQHRQASALLHNIQNIRIRMGKKPIVSVTYQNERISIENSLPYLKCVLRLLCGPQADLWPFHGVLCKRFSLPHESLYFECYATMLMLTNAHISSLGYQWFLHAGHYGWQFLFRTVRPGQTTVRRVVTRMK